MRRSPTLLVLLCVLGAGVTTGAFAAADSGPQLIAKGPRWKSVDEIKRFAEQGDTLACLEYGGRLLSGEGVAVDAVAARQFFARAAAAGSGDALFRLGKLWHDGIGGERDYGEAMKFYGDAAQAGVPEAMHNVGAMLVSARGVQRDYVEGLAWLIVALKHGAVSDAEQRTRERLAKRPADIVAAEARAKDLLAALKTPGAEAARPRFVVRATPGSTSPASPPRPLAPPKVETGGKVKVDVGPKLEAPKPTLDLPKN